MSEAPTRTDGEMRAGLIADAVFSNPLRDATWAKETRSVRDSTVKLARYAERRRLSTAVDTSRVGREPGRQPDRSPNSASSSATRASATRRAAASLRHRFAVRARVVDRHGGGCKSDHRGALQAVRRRTRLPHATTRTRCGALHVGRPCGKPKARSVPTPGATFTRPLPRCRPPATAQALPGAAGNRIHAVAAGARRQPRRFQDSE